MGAGGIGIAGGGIGLVIVIIMTLLGGGGPGDILNNIQGTDTNQAGTYEETEQEKELADFRFSSAGRHETVWSRLFKKLELNTRSQLWFYITVKSNPLAEQLAHLLDHFIVREIINSTLI
jgi:predicted metalloprotease